MVQRREEAKPSVLSRIEMQRRSLVRMTYRSPEPVYSFYERRWFLPPWTAMNERVRADIYARFERAPTASEARASGNNSPLTILDKVYRVCLPSFLLEQCIASYTDD